LVVDDTKYDVTKIVAMASIDGENVEQLIANLCQTWILLCKSNDEKKKTLWEELWNMKL
jgi:hypothetical protein